MTHGSQQNVSNKLSTRAGRDADPRVALPLTYSPPRRSVTASDPLSSAMAGLSVNGSTTQTANGHPTIVQSSAEHVSKPMSSSSSSSGGSAGSAANGADMVHYTTDTGPGVPFQAGHFLMVDGLNERQFDLVTETVGKILGWNYKLLNKKIMRSTRGNSYTLLMLFNDARDASLIQQELSRITEAWGVQFVSFERFSEAGPAAVEQDGRVAAKYDAQVMFEVKFLGRKPDIIDMDSVRDFVRALARSCGDVRVFKDVSNPNCVAWQFRAEFWKISDAKATLLTVGPGNAQYYKEWAVVAKEIIDLNPSGIGSTTTPPRNFNGAAVGIKCSPTGRTAWSIDENGNQIPQQPARQIPKCDFNPQQIASADDNTQQRERFHSAPSPPTPALFDHRPPDARSNSFAGTISGPLARYTGGRNGRAPQGKSQNVLVENILNGSDVRTTIMLRNVPNRWTSDDLKAALDAIVPGCYDFSYLRIDFSQNTNVGYAFVNFIDPRYILDFIKFWVDREWEGGRWPRKVCQISYATIQNIESLVGKFRNSAVMEEFPGFRPKLFWTWDTASDSSMVGLEREFPAPDNLTKKQRSHDNAGQIGLYAPRSGQRGGDRSRRSQFDRGTPSQINEDAYYNLVSAGNHRGGAAGGSISSQPRAALAPRFNPIFYTGANNGNNSNNVNVNVHNTTTMPDNFGLNGFNAAPGSFVAGGMPRQLGRPSSSGSIAPNAGNTPFGRGGNNGTHAHGQSHGQGYASSRY